MTHSVGPPLFLNSARVLLYAHTGGAGTYTSRVTISSGQSGELRDVGPVPRIAICEDLASDRFLVMYCNNRWKVLAASLAPSIDVAKDRAERGYAGIVFTEYRPLTKKELAEVKRQRRIMRELARKFPLDGHDPHAA